MAREKKGPSAKGKIPGREKAKAADDWGAGGSSWGAPSSPPDAKSKNNQEEDDDDFSNVDILGMFGEFEPDEKPKGSSPPPNNGFPGAYAPQKSGGTAAALRQMQQRNAAHSTVNVPQANAWGAGDGGWGSGPPVVSLEPPDTQASPGSAFRNVNRFGGIGAFGGAPLPPPAPPPPIATTKTPAPVGFGFGGATASGGPHAFPGSKFRVGIQDDKPPPTINLMEQPSQQSQNPRFGGFGGFGGFGSSSQKPPSPVAFTSNSGKMSPLQKLRGGKKQPKKQEQEQAPSQAQGWGDPYEVDASGGGDNAWGPNGGNDPNAWGAAPVPDNNDGWDQGGNGNDDWGEPVRSPARNQVKWGDKQTYEPEPEPQQSPQNPKGGKGRKKKGKKNKDAENNVDMSSSWGHAARGSGWGDEYQEAHNNSGDASGGWGISEHPEIRDGDERGGGEGNWGGDGGGGGGGRANDYGAPRDTDTSGGWGAPFAPATARSKGKNGHKQANDTSMFLDSGLGPKEIGAEVRIEGSNGIALEPLQTALFGMHRVAEGRLVWTLPYQHDPRVIALNDFVERYSYAIAQYSFLKYIRTREKGAVVSNADWSNEKTGDPVFDWMSFPDSQKTRDRTFQRSIAANNPANICIVYIVLASKSGMSVGIWRRRIAVPEKLRTDYQKQIREIENGLRDKVYTVKVDVPLSSLPRASMRGNSFSKPVLSPSSVAAAAAVKQRQKSKRTGIARWITWGNSDGDKLQKKRKEA